MRALLTVLLLGACDGSSSTTPDAPEGIDAPLDAPMLGDPCPAIVACPSAPADLAMGGGLRGMDRCAFPLVFDPAQRDTFHTRIDALPAKLTRVTLADVATDLNRAATKVTSVPGNPPGLRNAWMWQSGDEAVEYWIPQGVTGSFDANGNGVVGGRKLVLVSWYYERANDPGSTVEKGVRIAIADVTNPAAVAYRFALLVSPTAAGTFAAIEIHAGGLAWIGDRLYVPVTTGGFRVFDLSRILTLDGAADSLGPDAGGVWSAYGYAYAIPELARYTVGNAACAPRFSFVSKDDDVLVSGEYDAASIRGRIHRWPLAPSGDLELTSTNRVLPDAAFFMGESHVQGALARNDTYWLSSSRPAGGAGELDRLKAGMATARLPWSDSPEDLAFDPQNQTVWSLSEGLNARYLFEVALSAID